MAGRTNMRLCQQLHNILETHLTAIQKIFINAITMYNTLKGHFIKIDSSKFATGIVKGKTSRSAIHSRSFCRTTENKIFALFAAKRLH